ncbi:uncharacterized protein K02A2.6-like [Cydia splendana]|uniref:uncharacterized protein K02A2.6-like n=1 Tax=Cydia splendana TaxID=1100963 RepID=UPI00300D128B
MSIGKLQPFDPSADDWALYVDRLEQYFIVNSVTDALKVPTLITVMGSASYELLVTLCTPDKPSTKKFEVLKELMTNHLQPKRSIMAERYKFRQRIQKKGESLAVYVADLKKMTQYCDFKTELENNLRDQLVCGIADDTIRQRLFVEDALTFAKAWKLAVAMEAAEKDAAAVDSRTRGTSKEVVEVLYASASGSGARRQGSSGTWRSNGATQVAGRSKAAPQAWGGRAQAKQAPVAGAASAGAPRAREQGQCRVCGGNHDAATCKFRVYSCRVCMQQGHLKKMCPRLQTGARVHALDANEEDEEELLNEVQFNALSVGSLSRYKPFMMTLDVNGIGLEMEVDSGSAISCISLECYQKLFNNLPILTPNLLVNFYAGGSLRPVGRITPIVKYKNKEMSLDLFVIDGGKNPLLGRQWLYELKMGVEPFSCNKIDTKLELTMDSLISRYKDVFADGLGRYTGGTVALRVRSGAAPVYMRARPLAYALRAPVERALDQLQRDGIITPVETSDWATPIVPVIKRDGGIRICGDYKLTLNRCLEVDRFPLPRVEDLLVKLHGGETFSKIDLSQAYAQFELDEASKPYTVINTHKGLYMYNRLIYGLSSSPGIFQRKLEQLFADLPRVGVFLDDVIITGVDREDHLRTLHQVLGRLEKFGLKVKKEKCSFFAESVTYLGFRISKQGVHTCPEKIKVIKDMAIPANVTELRSFIGMIMYYGKFVKNISMTLTPLYKLLRKGASFSWTKECSEAFNAVKRCLVSSSVLAHYDPELPLCLTTDASSSGVGAVISHQMPDGTERPVAYASRVLNAAEVNYSQIQREALGIVFGIKKFHQYLYGRRFLLRTDHKPLVSIFGDKGGIPSMAASRLQRWAVILSGYQYDIEYVPTDKNGADALSRLPVGKQAADRTEVTYVQFVQDFLPITSDQVRANLKTDDLLRKVVMYLQSGWPAKCDDPELQSYWVRRHELYSEAGCVMWGYRMVIPTTLRNDVLRELHIGHFGVVKMKSLARSYVWWPGIDAEIEKTCMECTTCALEAPAPAKSTPQAWPYLEEVWSRLHMDFLGPLNGMTYLVVVDSSSKWIEVKQMTRTTADDVIRVLREMFARFGLPKMMVSDNGPPFTSGELTQFMQFNGIKQTYSPVYHPSSNGAAEGAVKLVKKTILKALRDRQDVDAALQSYLLAYRNSIHSSTGESPARLLQRRGLRTRLDLLRADAGAAAHECARAAQLRQRENAGGVSRSYSVGDNVWARNFSKGEKWVSGTITEQLGSRNYLVQREDGQIIKRHIDQLRNNSRLAITACPAADYDDNHDNSEPCAPPGPASVPPAPIPKRVPVPVERYGNPILY